MKWLRDFLPHLSIAMLLGLPVLIYCHERNPMMSFLTSKASFAYLMTLCVVGLAVAVMDISDRRRQARRRQSREYRGYEER